MKVPNTDVLLISLETAVPLWILELRQMPDEIEREIVRQTWAHEAADVIASKGDVLQFGSKRKGETADAFNHLARGLAAAAFQPGGVDFAGKHWEITEPEDAADPDEDPDLAWAPRARHWYQRPIVDAVRSL